MELKKDKHIIIPVVLVLAGIIAWRSWHDMHPPPPPAPTAFDSYFLIRDDATLAAVTADKENTHALAVWAGEFKTGKDKKISFAASPVTPASLPQREIILLYTMDSVPAADDATVDSLAADIHKSAEKWNEQGDLINDIYLDPVGNIPDAAPLFALCNPLREGLHKDYWLGLLLDRKALEKLPDPVKQLAEIQKSTRTIVFDAKKSLKPGETMGDMIMKLNTYDVPFMLHVEEMPDFKTVQKQLSDKSKEGARNFVAFLLDTEKLRKAAQ